jgi:hypothetical protein
MDNRYLFQSICSLADIHTGAFLQSVSVLRAVSALHE